MTNKAWGQLAGKNPMLGYLDANLRGASQVFFQNNPVTGGLILAGIFWGAHASGNLNVAFGAVIGLLVATSMAILLKLDRGSFQEGLFGFNGILVGVAVPTFLGNHPMMWSYLVLGAAVSTIVTVAVDKVVRTWGVPASTAPFVFTTWLLLLGAYSFAKVPISGMGPAALPVAVRVSSVYFSSHVLLTILSKNFSQVYLIGNALTGILFFIAIAISSLRGAAFALIGSVVGLGAALALSASPTAIIAGFYGFNAVLAAMAVEGVFQRSALRGVLYAILAAIFSVVVEAALTTALSPIGIPALTFPFVLTMWLFLLPKEEITSFPHRHVPERKSSGTAGTAKKEGMTPDA